MRLSFQCLRETFKMLVFATLSGRIQVKPPRLRGKSHKNVSLSKCSLNQTDIGVLVRLAKCLPNVVIAALTDKGTSQNLGGESDPLNSQSVEIDTHN